jgi:hypothetical protein
MGLPSAIVYLAAGGKWSKAKLLSTSIGLSLVLILVPALFLFLFHNHSLLEMFLGRESQGQQDFIDSIFDLSGDTDAYSNQWRLFAVRTIVYQTFGD